MEEPAEPLVGGVGQRGGQAAVFGRVVQQGDHRGDVCLQQLAGEAAIVPQQGGVGICHITRGHHSRPVEGEVEVADPHLLDFIHLKQQNKKQTI